MLWTEILIILWTKKSTTSFRSVDFINFNWWLQRESNQRHKDFQSFALPTELWSQKKWRFRRGSNPRSSAWQADVLTSCTTEPWLRGKDLNLRPSGYEPDELPTAPPRDIKFLNGGGKGIRTPAPLARPPGFQDRSLQPDLGIPPK